MAISINVMLGWCRAPANTRAEIAAALMPGRLLELGDFTIKEIKEATKGFSCLPANAFVVSPHTTKRLIQLALWVQDAERLGLPAEFGNGTNQASFVTAIDDAQHCEDIHKVCKKTTESLGSIRITPPLKSSAGWGSWMVSVEAALTLTLAYGSKVIPLAYVIRPDTPDPMDDQATWEQTAIATAPLKKLHYNANRMTVHLFILNNISEESDAYTYIQPLLQRNTG